MPAVDKLAEATIQPVSTTITSTKTDANRTKPWFRGLGS